MQITSYDYPGRFLEQFEKSQRSTVANWYCYAYRVAPGTLDDLIEGMRQTCLKKARDYQAGTNWTPAWLDHMQEQDLLVTQLREVLETDESYNFAEFIIARENLPEAEKQRLKALRADEQRVAYMQAQPPTGKQLVYLKGLGHAEDQMPTSKAEASKLIDQYLQRSKAKRQAGVSASGR